MAHVPNVVYTVPLVCAMKNDGGSNIAMQTDTFRDPNHPDMRRVARRLFQTGGAK